MRLASATRCAGGRTLAMSVGRRHAVRGVREEPGAALRVVGPLEEGPRHKADWRGAVGEVEARRAGEGGFWCRPAPLSLLVGQRVGCVMGRAEGRRVALVRVRGIAASADTARR